MYLFENFNFEILLYWWYFKFSLTCYFVLERFLVSLSWFKLGFQNFEHLQLLVLKDMEMVFEKEIIQIISISSFQKLKNNFTFQNFYHFKKFITAQWNSIHSNCSKLNINRNSTNFLRTFSVRVSISSKFITISQFTYFFLYFGNSFQIIFCCHQIESNKAYSGQTNGDVTGGANSQLDRVIQLFFVGFVGGPFKFYTRNGIHNIL